MRRRRRWPGLDVAHALAVAVVADMGLAGDVAQELGQLAEGGSNLDQLAALAALELAGAASRPRVGGERSCRPARPGARRSVLWSRGGR
jgi:hypothetical protein